MPQTFQVVWFSELSNGWSFSLPSVLQHTTTITLSLYPSSPWHFNARALWHFSTHWWWCNVHVHLSSNCCNNSLEHLKSMSIFSTISSALHSTVFTLQYCPFNEGKTKQLNFCIVMLGTMKPNVFQISPCCKACCLIQSWFFKYVNKVKSGNPYSYTISLLLHFYHSPNDHSFPTTVLLMFFSSLYSYSSFPHYVESKIQNIMLW
jgi:hypothetical protein